MGKWTPEKIRAELEKTKRKANLECVAFLRVCFDEMVDRAQVASELSFDPIEMREIREFEAFAVLAAELLLQMPEDSPDRPFCLQELWQITLDARREVLDAAKHAGISEHFTQQIQHHFSRCEYAAVLSVGEEDDSYFSKLQH